MYRKIYIKLCQKKVQFTNDLKTRGEELHMIPPRLTNILQPADVSWMKVLKQQYKDLWNDWMLNAPKTFTASNNLRSPGFALVITWISQIWSNFSIDNHLFIVDLFQIIPMPIISNFVILCRKEFKWKTSILTTILRILNALNKQQN